MHSLHSPDIQLISELRVGSTKLDKIRDLYHYLHFGSVISPSPTRGRDGQFFYEGIDGFKHEGGYAYRLKTERYSAFPGEKEPPQYASRYGHRLLEVISRQPAMS